MTQPSYPRPLRNPRHEYIRRTLLDRLNRPRDVAPVKLDIQFGTVSAVAAGASTDGRAQVSVTFGADTIDAPYLINPALPLAVDDIVSVLFVDGSPLILGPAGGFPTF